MSTRPIAVLALLVSGALALTACSAGTEEPEPTATSPTATTLAEADAGDLGVVRTSFCASVDADAVEAALDGPVGRTAHYGNGERAPLTRGVRDVAHENGCTYVGDGGAVARGWVFAPPVGAQEARDLVTAAEEGERCEPVDSAAAYGDPSTAQICRTPGGEGQRRTVEVSYRGLFGDAWLACSLQVPAADNPGADVLVPRADAWCLEVATAAAT